MKKQLLLAAILGLLTGIHAAPSAPGPRKGPAAARAAAPPPVLSPEPVEGSKDAAYSILESTPSRIFTPNGDGVNDTFTLRIDNPGGSILSQKKILDIGGSEVADFLVTGDETANPLILTWDGRDKSGNPARSGVYLYQVQAEGKVLNGTMVVAR